MIHGGGKDYSKDRYVCGLEKTIIDLKNNPIIIAICSRCNNETKDFWRVNNSDGKKEFVCKECMRG